MIEILWMNLNFTELLTILQLITIRNSSDSNNIKPQAIKAIKRASETKQIRFSTLDSWKFSL